MQNQTAKKCDEKIILSAYVCKPRYKIFFTGDGRTKQSFKAECDINNIMKLYMRTGVLDFTQKNQPRYGDCTGWEFNAAMLKVAEAKGLFAQLPAELRNKFSNDPGEFFDFVQDPKNRAECEELKLLPPTPKPDAPASGTPTPTPPATTAPAGSGPHARGPGRRGKISEGDDAPRPRGDDQTNSDT